MTPEELNRAELKQLRLLLTMWRKEPEVRELLKERGETLESLITYYKRAMAKRKPKPQARKVGKHWEDDVLKLAM